MYHIQFIQVSPVKSQPITTKYFAYARQIQKQHPVGISDFAYANVSIMIINQAISPLSSLDAGPLLGS